SSGQHYFDNFDFDDYLCDELPVDLDWKPHVVVERMNYRFRIVNASVSRFVKLAQSDDSPMIDIANDGNLLLAHVTLTQSQQQGLLWRPFQRWRGAGCGLRPDLLGAEVWHP